MTLEDMPEIITAKNISEHLQLSKRKVYDLMGLSPEVGGIKSFNIGKAVRVAKSDYLSWYLKTIKREPAK